jgi:hypothetical protein
MGKRKPLTEREQEALSWAKSNYPRWRKRWNETLEQHMAAMPQYMQLPDYYPLKSRREKLILWFSWYLYPFGIPEWNENVRIVRHLLRDRAV